MSGACGTYERMRSAYWVFGKRPLGRRRRREENNINTDIQEVGWEGMRTGVIWIRTGSAGWRL